MGLNLNKTVVEFLSRRPEQKFKAREIAQWIFENYPAECAEKKANSSSLNSDAELVQQIVAEIGSYRPSIQKKNPQIKTTEGRPRQFYWTEKSPQTEITDVERATESGRDADAESNAPSDLFIQFYQLTFGLNLAFIQSELTTNDLRINKVRRGTSGCSLIWSAWRI